MTKKEFIELLNEFPDDAQVLVYDAYLHESFPLTANDIEYIENNNEIII